MSWLTKKSALEKAVEQHVQDEIERRLSTLRYESVSSFDVIYSIFPELDSGEIDDQVVARDLWFRVFESSVQLTRRSFRKNYPRLFNAIVFSIVNRLQS